MEENKPILEDWQKEVLEKIEEKEKENEKEK